MPDNYGSAALGVLGEIQRQDIEAKRAPVELQHMEALTQLNKANVQQMMFTQGLQKAGVKALEGWKFDPTDPVNSTMEAAGRVMPVAPTLGGELLKDAGMLLSRQATAALHEAQALVKRNAIEKAQMETILGSFRGVNSEAELPAIEALLMQRAPGLEMKPQEMQEAIQSAKGLWKQGGPLGIDQALNGLLSANQSALVRLKQQAQATQEKLAKAKADHLKAQESRAAANEAGRNARSDASIKARGNVELKPKLSIAEAKKQAAAAIQADEDLSTAEAALKLKWSQDIGQRAISKVEESYRQRQGNPNIPLKDMTDAIREATADVKSGVKREPGWFGRQGPAKEVPQAAKTKELPSDLSNFKPEPNVIYTRGGIKYKYNAARHGLEKIE